MNRYDFQKLAGLRLEDARVLLENRRYEGCYYLSGYVVECGLKACVARLTKRYDFPDKGLLNAYTHDLTALLKLARLEVAQDAESKRDHDFRLNWYVVKQWKEQSRYELSGRQQQAEDLFNAVADRKHGVLRWIKQHW